MTNFIRIIIILAILWLVGGSVTFLIIEGIWFAAIPVGLIGLSVLLQLLKVTIDEWDY